MTSRAMRCSRFAALVNDPRTIVARNDHERFAAHYDGCDACKEKVCRRNNTWRELFLQKVMQITNDRFKERLATLQVWEKTLAAFLSLAEVRPKPRTRSKK